MVYIRILQIPFETPSKLRRSFAHFLLPLLFTSHIIHIWLPVQLDCETSTKERVSNIIQQGDAEVFYVKQGLVEASAEIT